MRSVADHRAAALALAPATRVETVPLEAAYARVLAEDVTARADVPPFANSAMDGYAVRAAEAAPGARLPVAFDIPAGAAPGVLATGTAARIMTGAPVPAGADAIVPREDTDDGLGTVRIDAAPSLGAFVRAAAEDARAGDVVLGRGVVLGPAALAAIAGAGWAEVAVAARPRVLIVSTGDELAAPGQELAPGQIHDSNTTLMGALVAAAGGMVARAVRTGDDPDGFFAALGDLDDVDLVLTAGGVSVGAFDVVKASLAPLGVDFARVAMQPGKPQGMGRVHGVAAACLPGNPVSVAASFTAFVEPMLRAALALPPRAFGTAVVAESWASPPRREQWTPVVAGPEGVRPATSGVSRSNLGLSLSRAEAWAIVPPQVDRVEPGDTVALMRFLP